VAAQNLLKTTLPIGKMRGELHDYQGIKVLCTYHPAYLLRNPSAKRLAWDDMKLLMKAMGRKVES
jgi:DNA polymerase